jgi:hypothetical protein
MRLTWHSPHQIYRQWAEPRIATWQRLMASSGPSHLKPRRSEKWGFFLSATQKSLLDTKMLQNSGKALYDIDFVLDNRHRVDVSP